MLGRIPPPPPPPPPHLVADATIPGRRPQDGLNVRDAALDGWGWCGETGSVASGGRRSGCWAWGGGGGGPGWLVGANSLFLFLSFHVLSPTSSPETTRNPRETGSGCGRPCSRGGRGVVRRQRGRGGGRWEGGVHAGEFGGAKVFPFLAARPGGGTRTPGRGLASSRGGGGGDSSAGPTPVCVCGGGRDGGGRPEEKKGRTEKVTTAV